MNDATRATIRRLRATLTKDAQHLEANLPIENDLLEAAHTALTLLEQQDTKFEATVATMKGQIAVMWGRLERFERKAVRS